MASDLVRRIERCGVYAPKLEYEDEKLCGKGGRDAGVRFGIKHTECTLCKDCISFNAVATSSLSTYVRLAESRRDCLRCHCKAEQT